MTVLTLEHGLILQAPDLATELAHLLEEWQNQSLVCQMEGAIQLNPMIWDELEEEFE